MEEQNNQNLENQEFDVKEEIKEILQEEKKTLTQKQKIAIISGAVFAIIVVLFLIFVVFKHRHQWCEATCTTPMTCRTCGESEGEVRNHNFGNWIESVKGDCFTVETIKKRICKDCQYEETQILPPSHDYSYGICTKCKKPIIENITLPKDTNKYNATLEDKNHVSLYGVKWIEICESETLNTYHCKIGYRINQYDYNSLVLGKDFVNLQYLITDSKGNVVFDKKGCLQLYDDKPYSCNFEFDITLNPDETYKLSIKILGGI